MREIFRHEIRREKVARNGPLYTTAAMKTFVPPFFNHFSLSLNRKTNCVNEVVVCSQ